MSSNRPPRVRARQGLLHSPVPGGVRGDAAQMHPAGAVLDEHQHVHALQQHGVHVQEIEESQIFRTGDPIGSSAERNRIIAGETKALHS